MERNHFPPPTLPPDGTGRRDLPPEERIPMPRMEEGGDGGFCDHGDVHRPTACVSGCGEGSWGLVGYPLAMVYVPCQGYHALYDTSTALSRGTLFSELDLPLGGEGGHSTEGCACRYERRGV